MSRSILAALLALSILAVPSAAHAERWSGDDPAGDVVGYDYEAEDPCDPAAQTAQPDNADADLERIGVSHRQHSVLLRASTRSRATADYRTIAFFVETPDRAYVVGLGQTHAAQAGRHAARPHRFTVLERIPGRIATMTCEDAFGVEDSGSSSGTERAVDRRFVAPRSEVDGDSVLIRVHRHCLGSPAWVRVGAYSTSQVDDSHLSLDTWLPADTEPTGFVIGALSPKVRAGR